MSRLALPDILTLAGRALGKVDLAGRRGCTLVTLEEIEAMACALALAGLKPVWPGTYPPTSHQVATEGPRK